MEKSHCLSHAERELKVLCDMYPTEENPPIIKEFIPEILALTEKFGKSGQSGGSAPYVARAIADAVERLCNYGPICPLTGNDDEWFDVAEMNNGEPMFQNNRDSRVFKNGKDGQAYFVEAIVFDGDLGGRFTGSVKHDGKIIGSTQFIKQFPFTPKTFYVDVIDYRWNDKSETEPDADGDWWTHSIKDEKQLAKVFEYYDQR